MQDCPVCHKRPEIEYRNGGLIYLSETRIRCTTCGLKTSWCGAGCGAAWRSDSRDIAEERWNEFCDNYRHVKGVVDKKAVRDKLIEVLDETKKVNPEQVVVIETPKGTISVKIGDALVYEDPHGWVVIDSE